MPYSIPISIYDEFASDFLALSQEGQAAVGALLKILQSNPYDPSVQQKVFIHGEIFEYPLPGGYSIFWEVHHFTIMNMKVLILAIERRRGGRFIF